MDTRAVNPQKTLVTPIWVFGIRIAQVVLSIVVLGMAAAWSDYTLFDAPSLAIAAAVFTWLIVAYILVTEKVPAVNAFYTIYAVIVLDAFMIIIWLSTWALNAARRASLGNVGAGRINGGGGRFCYDGICYDYKKRSIERRAMTWQTLSGLLAGVAAIGAFIWVLFIVTFVWTVINFLSGRKDGRFTLGSSSTVTADHNMEEQKVVQGQQAQQPQQAQQFTEPQYNAVQQQQAYPQQPSDAPQVATEYQQPQQQYAHDPQVTPQQPHHQ
ncbi:G-coupled receptor [Cordyceps militaris]|uniref:G-coupled receptor n=1 Tax=Cordyceps militaris TaxID=73501 RepID=A0A2H4SIF9_CORMI|nr:G-coupled receptor [Cordyceps militaris]